MDGDNYIKIYSFMRKMGLSGVKRDVYALIYGFTKHSENAWFNGSSGYIVEWTGSKRSVLEALKELTSEKLIIKQMDYRNGSKFCRYRVVVPDSIATGKCKGCKCDEFGKLGIVATKPDEDKALGISDKSQWFLDFWSKYPRKMGKTVAEKRFKSQIKNHADYQLLIDAVNRYKQYILNNQTQREFIKHGSTWMGEWRDWLEVDIDIDDKPPELSVDDRIANMNARNGLNIIDVTPRNGSLQGLTNG